MKSTDYTVAITNFARPEHLRRCLQSVKNLPKVVVACYGAGPDHRKIIDEIRPGTRCYITENDHGENRLLLQAVALADTPWVVILHDDDQLTQDFESVLRNVNPGDAGFIGWDGLTEWFDGRPAKRVTPWGGTPAGLRDTASLIPKVTTPHGGMVQSPVTMMLRKDLALEVLSWCEDGLAEFHTRPKMMIGNEIALLFGHLKKYETWYHISHPLVKFGHWAGSETVKWINGENPELIAIYDNVRRKFGAEQFLFRHDSISPILVHAYTTGGPNPRQELAHQTWREEHSTMENDYLIVPVRIDTADLTRNSGVIHDPRKLPFVKDLLDYAASFCYGGKDVVFLTNDDVCITEGDLSNMVSRACSRGSTYAHRRDFHPRHLQAVGLTSLSRKLTRDEISAGHEHAGTDAVMMTKQWWSDIGSRHFPDFVIGCEAWDTIMIMVMRMSGSGWGWRNATYHFHHGGWWEDKTHRFQNPGQIHNRRLAKNYLVAHSIYRGEFEPMCKRDPAYPRFPAGCDTHPDTPVVKYIGDPNAFKPAVAVAKPRVVAPEPVKKDTKIVPMPLHPDRILPPPTLERCIVYPYNSVKAKWEELRFSLRSVEKFFEDKDCPIHIYGTKMPGWLRKNKRVVFKDAWTYSDALIRGVQAAKEVLWMNDDGVMLQPLTWDDFRTPRYLRPVREDWTREMSEDINPWQNGLIYTLTELTNLGIKDLRIYSTHAPYLYRRDEAIETLQRFGVWEKIPLEMLYFHRYAVDPQPINGFLAQSEDFGIAKFLNHTDTTLTPALKEKLKSMFPDYAPWEMPLPFD